MSKRNQKSKSNETKLTIIFTITLSKLNMKYWIIVTNDENWNVLKRFNVWGTTKRYEKYFYNIHIGDRCLIYVKGGFQYNGSIITAEYEVISEVYEDDSKIFHSLNSLNLNEVFPYRIKLKLTKLMENPIDFKNLVPKLSFIYNKKNWGLHLFGAPVKQIPKEDYETITSKLN